VDQKKILLALATIAWGGFVVAAYFVVQKPFALQVAGHLMSLAWTLIVTSMLLFNALALGTFTIKQLIPETADDNPSLLALAGGIGLGELGLLGFIFAAGGATNLWVLLTAQILILGGSIWKGSLHSVGSLLKNSIAEMISSGLIVPPWIKWAAILAFSLTFLRTLLPPVDAFDALLYHLTIPELWLHDGGLASYNFPHYWFPGLVEGAYLWGLGLGSEIVPQQIHFAWALFTTILIWDWTRRIWGDLTAGWALMLLISMPALLVLASWAYTDMALAFFGVAMLYTLSYGREQTDTRWWNLSAISAGMAMGVKYTSFVMPLTAVILIGTWKLHEKRDLYVEVTKFTFISTAVGILWYLRNWVWMGNPIYPFLFGGRYWDQFRSDWFATPGTGSGWDIGALISLPLTITLGYQDINSIDADIGPLLLLALPFALWAMAGRKQVETSRKITLTTIGFFALFSAAFWTYGYITTRDLWQTRLLLPAIIPFVIPASIGILSISALDTKRLRLSFVVSSVAAMSIFVNLLDISLSMIARNPLAVVTGFISSQSYFETYQPGYAHALQMISRTPLDSRVYSLFEPRSYGAARSLQPDPILDNFPHDIYLYGKPEDIINTWHLQGYTHVLLNARAASLVLENAGDRAILDKTIDLLKPISTSPDGDYELLEIPAR